MTPAPMIDADNAWRGGPASASTGERAVTRPQPKALPAHSQASSSRPGFQPNPEAGAAACSISRGAATAAAPKAIAPANRRVREAVGDCDQCRPGKPSARAASAAAPARRASKANSAPECRSATPSTAAAHSPVDSATAAANSQGSLSPGLRRRTRWPMSMLT